ncbi:unnamed protein product, partial [Didymodactylos carnosus]
WKIRPVMSAGSAAVLNHLSKIRIVSSTVPLTGADQARLHVNLDLLPALNKHFIQIALVRIMDLVELAVLLFTIDTSLSSPSPDDDGENCNKYFAILTLLIDVRHTYIAHISHDIKGLDHTDISAIECDSELAVKKYNSNWCCNWDYCRCSKRY